MPLSRDLKHKTVVMAAIAGLAYAGAADAAIGIGSASEGELFLDLINTTAGVSATFDLGVPTVVSQPLGAGLGVDPTIESFARDALSRAGIQLGWDLSGTAAWNAFVAAASASLPGSKFDIKALGPDDPFGVGVVYLTTVSGGDLANQAFSVLQNFVQVGDFVVDTNNQATHNAEANGANFATSANTSLYHETAVGDSWKNNLNGLSSGAIGSELAFYELSGDFARNAGGTAAMRPYGGVWNLSEAGVLSYTTSTPVPEPGSWAVLLAGLAGAITRWRFVPRAGYTPG